MPGTRKLGRATDSRNAMLRAMVTYLFENGKIETTVTRAKEVRSMAEKMVTLGKQDDLHAKRQVFSYITKEDVAKKVIDEIGPKYADRNGGYTRIYKTGPRRGDAAEMAIIELDEKVLANMDKIDNDRAILRAIHFFKENERVERAAKAVEEKDGETVLKLLSESGKSSWELLQNCYPIKAYTEQKISVALALTDLFLEKLGKGICRIHGGGFAGVIMCVVPEEETENYVSYISEFAGKENVYPMNIRAVGAVHIEK